MNIVNMLPELKQRTLVAQLTHPTELSEQFANTDLKPYVGFDPTAESLHIGSLVPLLTLRRLQLAGQTPIALVGGATGLIGDPSFKANERALNAEETVQAWSDSLRRQIEPFLDFDCTNKAIVVNNHDWLGTMPLLTFLRDIGRHFRVSQMLARDSVKQRAGSDVEGLSYLEFAYPTLQAFDFLELHRRHRCRLQIGGSDQWGNIVSGIELARRADSTELFGMTLPLITKSDGTKFGKTEAGTVWLDARKTSPYAFRQYWLTISDADVYRMLRQFTFLPLQRIAEIEMEDSQGGRPQAQGILADEVTRIVHGDAACEASRQLARALFEGDPRDLSAADLEQLAKGGLTTVNISPGEAPALVELLVQGSMASSRAEARIFAQSNSIRVNGVAVQDVSVPLNDAQRLHQRYAVLQRGRKNHCLVTWAASA